MALTPSKSTGLDWVMVVLRMADGSERVETFASRFQAELFVSWIPALQMASEEFAEVRGALIRETVRMTVALERVDYSN